MVYEVGKLLAKWRPSHNSNVDSKRADFLIRRQFESRVTCRCRTGQKTRPHSVSDRQLPKFRLQILESFLKYFRETVFDQINLIHVHIQCRGDFGRRDLLDGLKVKNLA